MTQYLNYTICCLCDVLTWYECDYSVCQLYIWRSYTPWYTCRWSTGCNKLYINYKKKKVLAYIYCYKCFLHSIASCNCSDAVIWFVRNSTQATLVANMGSFFVWTWDKKFYMCIIYILIFWVMILCNLLNSYQILEETFSFILIVGWRLRLCSYRIQPAANQLCRQAHWRLAASHHNGPLTNSHMHY